MATPDEVRFFDWRDVLIADWFRRATEDGAKRMVQELDAVHGRTHKPVAIMHLAAADSAPPTSSTRRFLADVFRENQAKIAMHATVIEGEGFRAASVRAVASSIAMMSRVQCPYEVFGSVQRAVDRVVEGLKYDAADRQQLIEAVATLRSKRESAAAE